MYVTEHVTVLGYILVSLVRGPLPQLLPGRPAPAGPQGPCEPLVVEETRFSNEEENQNTRDYFPCRVLDLDNTKSKVHTTL